MCLESKLNTYTSTLWLDSFQAYEKRNQQSFAVRKNAAWGRLGLQIPLSCCFQGDLSEKLVTWDYHQWIQTSRHITTGQNCCPHRAPCWRNTIRGQPESSRHYWRHWQAWTGRWYSYLYRVQQPYWLTVTVTVTVCQKPAEDAETISDISVKVVTEMPPDAEVVYEVKANIDQSDAIVPDANTCLSALALQVVQSTLTVLMLRYWDIPRNLQIQFYHETWVNNVTNMNRILLFVVSCTLRLP